jgi:hypothetical protein
MGADSTLDSSDDAASAVNGEGQGLARASVPRPPRPVRRTPSVQAANDEGDEASQNGAGSSVKARHGQAEDGDGWGTDEADELDGESDNHKAARAELERSLHKDDFEADTRARLGNLRRGLFDDGDADQAPPQASSDAPPTPRSNPRPEVKQPEPRPPVARLPSQGPSDATADDEPLLAQLKQLRTPTKINPPLGARMEEESWPTHTPMEADQSPGVPLSAMDEHEATVVGSASKDILEMAASQEINTRVFQAPPELIDLAKRKREEQKRGGRSKEKERDTVKPDPARLAADRKASAALDNLKTPVPEVRVTMSDAAPAVASESAPPVARGVVRHVEEARAKEARQAQEAADPRIDVEVGTPESLARDAADWSPQSSDNPVVDSVSALKRTWFTNLVYWAPLLIAFALIGYFVYRMLTQAR